VNSGTPRVVPGVLHLLQTRW